MKESLKTYFNNYKRLLDARVKKIKRVLWSLGRDAFLLILIFISLEVLFSEFLFYKYVFLAKIEEQKIIVMPAKFQENVYQSVLQEWQTRENIFKNSSQKNYPDPFD